MKKTIANINRTIKETLVKPRTNAAIFGLTESTVAHDRDERIPALIREDGEILPTFPDDRNALTLYHTMSQKSYASETARGYGDRMLITETYEMALVVCGKRKHYNPIELETEITRILQTIGTSRNQVTPVNSNFDKTQVWTSEYSSTPMPLPSDFFMFKITYRIKQTKSACAPANH